MNKLRLFEKALSFGKELFSEPVFTPFRLIGLSYSALTLKSSMTTAGSGTFLEQEEIKDKVYDIYRGVWHLGVGSLGQDWDIEGNNLVECLVSFCRHYRPDRKILVDNARIWLTWDDVTLERWTKAAILYDFRREEEPGDYPTARVFWLAVVTYVERSIREYPDKIA